MGGALALRRRGAEALSCSGRRPKSPGAAGNTGGTDNSARLGRPEPRWADGPRTRASSLRARRGAAHPGCADPGAAEERRASRDWEGGRRGAPDGRMSVWLRLSSKCNAGHDVGGDDFGHRSGRSDLIRPDPTRAGAQNWIGAPPVGGAPTRAERVGFEPTDRVAPITSLAGRPDQPDSGTSPASANGTHRRPVAPHAMSGAPAGLAVGGAATLRR